ncbi:metallophosphoesterase family protein [Parapedobacter sp. 10938]|uniref:metallophosphoesterase family protein n=1 Tax=Parapedobacter flavus TaxID=3110225 RepID=UPI002DBB47C9|nr:metallophosphoesterase [Parapedobacter sp. 10938]MEC3879574.1 metallophosphoesterase [Parapedobacter sp. 10938]
MLKRILGTACIGFLTLFSAQAQEAFSLAFLTDIHTNTNPESGSLEGFKQAIQSAENKNVDFILTGGDNADVDAMKSDQRNTAVKLFSDYKAIADQSSLPFYYTIGNHDRYWGDGEKSGAYGEKLFESFFGKTYYAFEHKGWLFIVLNSTQICNGQYCIDTQQQQWLSSLLAQTPRERPIVVSTHVPFLSLYYPVLEGRYTSADTFDNQKETFDLFGSHNLKLVLQGHQHLYEEIKVKGVQFITAGAVCANWWSGAFHGTEEGFLVVKTDGDEFTWEYVDYGWEVK